jgi:hypothetical protein
MIFLVHSRIQTRPARVLSVLSVRAELRRRASRQSSYPWPPHPRRDEGRAGWGGSSATTSRKGEDTEPSDGREREREREKEMMVDLDALASVPLGPWPASSIRGPVVVVVVVVSLPSPSITGTAKGDWGRIGDSSIASSNSLLLLCHLQPLRVLFFFSFSLSISLFSASKRNLPFNSSQLIGGPKVIFPTHAIATVP